MKTKLNLLTVGIFLNLAGAGFGQPSITTQPQSCTNIVGTTATFRVVANGAEPLAYQWQKLSGAWSDLAGCTTTNLVLTNVQTSHAADYRVVITYVDGAAISEVAHLTILVPPKITPTVSLQHKAIHVGSNAFFAVTAAGTAPLAYQWRLDGEDLPGQSNSAIIFSAVQPADEGDYIVVVTNVAGAVASEPARLWVVPPPSAFIRGDFTNGAFRYPYYYLMPTNYNPTRSYPLVCIFHGGGTSEDSFTNTVANLPEAKVFASYRQQAADPAIVVWPTLPGGVPWPPQYIWQTTNLLDNFISRFNIDTNRIYVSGASAGVPAAWDLLGLRRGFFAGGIVLAGGQGSASASAIKEAPLWAISAADDTTMNLVTVLRRAGGNPVYTLYRTGGHMGGIFMGASTPAVVDWLLAQRRGVAPTNEPLLSITSPSGKAVLFTGATNLNLAGTAAALDRAVTQVSWNNFANNAKGVAAGTHDWSVTNIPLVASKTNVITVDGTTTSWAPYFGGNTTFNDTLTVVCYPIRATLVAQGTNALLTWTGGGAPYRVQRATDLIVGDWTDFLTDATPPVSLPLEGTAGFYRIIGR